jgi:hypothetical protein
MSTKKMASPKMRDFVNAATMSGVIKHYDLGGASTLAPSVSPTAAPSAISSSLPLSNLIGNNPYQAQLAPTQSIDYSPTVTAASQNALAGYGQAQNQIASGQALQQQLTAEGMGQGPNPAQAQLAQNTGTNVANQAALMAGQRGAGANAGLIARQAAQQGAATQQGAIGQAATLQAQQQLAAQQGALAAQGQVSNQISNEQAINAGLFGTAAGATNTQNANLISNYGQAQGINAQASQNNANMAGQTAGGIFQGASSVSSLLSLAGGGAVPSPRGMPSREGAPMAAGGPVSWAGQFLNSTPQMSYPQSSGSGVGTSVPLNVPTLQTGNKTPQTQGQQKSPTNNKTPQTQGQQKSPTNTIQENPEENPLEPEDGGVESSGLGEGAGSIDAGGWAAKGGKVGKGRKVPAMLSPGEEYLPPKKAQAVAEGKAHPMSGKRVPGKAKVPGDSLKNDTVPAVLEEGGVVVKRSVMNTGDPEQVKRFVQAIQAKQGLKRKQSK